MFQQGQQIGLYTLIRKLGRGAFGEVWLVKEGVEYFAIKFPHKEQIDWKGITQEIGLWVLCGNHPNILPLISAKNFNGQIAIISEYAPDGSLGNLLKEKGKLPVAEALEMTIGILKGLEHLHESGIIHRDLKPANILLEGNTPRLADFGISRIITADSLSETISGTWAYMAPECFNGKRNVQTDIWSVGVILYRMLTGRLPFPQKEQTELVGAIILHQPEILFEEVPEEVKEILLKLLAKAPTERPTIPSILSDLQNYIDRTKEFSNHPIQSKKVLLATEEFEHETQINVLETQNLIPYRKGDKWGYCDAKKNILIDPIYDKTYCFSNGLSLVILNNKRGYIDKTGKLIIPFKYDSSTGFKIRVAGVTVGGKSAVIDEKGGYLTPLKYDRIVRFSDETAVVELKGKFGLVDQFGHEIVNPRYDYIGDFFEGLVSVELDGKHGFLDKNGNEVISPIYKYRSDFSEDTASVCLEGMYGFINKLGNVIVPFKYDYAVGFREGLAGVANGSTYGFINKYGREVIPFVYGDTSMHIGHSLVVTGGFNEGLSKAVLEYSIDEEYGISDTGWGFIDKLGNEIIPFIYDRAGDFTNGLARVELGKVVQFINKNGDCILQTDYEEVGNFLEGLAYVRSGKKYGFINQDGETVTQVKYDSIEIKHFHNGLAWVMLNGKEGYIGRDGTEYFED